MNKKCKVLAITTIFITTNFSSFNLFCMEQQIGNKRKRQEQDDDERKPLKKRKIEEIEKIEKCGICLDDITQHHDIKTFKCNHITHKACGERWLSTNNTCPVCRHEEYPVERQPEDEDLDIAPLDLLALLLIIRILRQGIEEEPPNQAPNGQESQESRENQPEGQ